MPAATPQQESAQTPKAPDLAGLAQSASKAAKGAATVAIGGAATAATLAKEKGTPAVTAAAKALDRKNLLWPVVIVVVVVLAAALLLPRACSSASLPFGIGGAKGTPVELKGDAKDAHDVAAKLLDAVKKGDTTTIGRYYLGNVEDLSLPSLATHAHVMNTSNLDPRIVAAFQAIEANSSKAKNVQGKLKAKLLSFNYEITSDSALGDIVSGNCNAALVDVRLSVPNVAKAEHQSMQAIQKERMEELYKQLLKYLITYALSDKDDAETTKDILKDVPKGVVDQLTSLVDDYYTTLDGALQNVEMLDDETVTLYVAKTKDGWKVAPVGLSTQFDLWGSTTVKFNVNGKWSTTETRAQIDYSYLKNNGYINSGKSDKKLSISPAGYQEAKLSSPADVSVSSKGSIEATNVKCGTDASGRTVITGTFENKGNDTMSGLIMLSAEVKDKKYSSVAFSSATTGVGALFGREVGLTGELASEGTVADMAPHEKRAFTIYPVEEWIPYYETLSELTDKASDLPEAAAYKLNLTSGSDVDIYLDSLDVLQQNKTKKSTDYLITYGVDDSLKVSLSSVEYGADGARRLLVRGTVKNTGKETVQGVVPVFVVLEDGAPAETIADEGYVALLPEVNSLYTEAGASDDVEMIETLAPGEEKPFSVECRVTSGAPDAIALRDVKVNGR